MSPALELTSVPEWAITPTEPGADTTGRWWTIIAFGPAGGEVARRWAAQIGRESAVRSYEVAVGDDERARAALVGALADARVGWRLMMAGPADACLRLRANLWL